MNADTFRTLAVVFLALAVIFVAVAIVLYRRFDIPAVRDELSGRAAQREIAALRDVRAGQWENADDLGAFRGRGRAGATPERGASPAAAGKAAAGHGTGSDMEFRQATGPASGMGGTGGTGQPSAASTGGQRSTDAGATHRLQEGPTVVQPQTKGAHTAPDTPRPAAQPERPVIEIPVAMASAAELADEGETSLMQFRKPSEHTSDDDESRTILVHADKDGADGKNGKNDR